jgi:hypothetical protein
VAFGIWRTVAKRTQDEDDPDEGHADEGRHTAADLST